MAFNDKTRRKVMQAYSQNATSGLLSWPIPRTGLLSRIYLAVRGTVSVLTTPTALSAQGFAAVVNNVNVTLNSGLAVYNTSGVGWHYLVRPYLDLLGDPVSSANNGRTAMSAAAFVADMIIPIQLNLRDAIGLLMLQNEQTLATLNVTIEAPANLAATTTYTTNPTITPYYEFFTVPSDPKDYPNLNVIHQVIEDRTALASGANVYNWPRGNLYLQTIHGWLNSSNAFANFSATPAGVPIQLRVNQTDYIQNTDQLFMDMSNPLERYNSRITGTFPFDFMSSAGLGPYDQGRDTIDSRALTDIASVFTTDTSGTLVTMRRQLVPLVG